MNQNAPLRLRNFLVVSTAAIAAAALLLPADVKAQTLLVDTGQPTLNLNSGLSLCATSCGGGATFQNLAGQFTLAQSSSISSVQGWIQAPAVGGQLAVVIRADNSGIPGPSLFSQTYTVPNQSTTGWVLFPLINQPILAASTPYWLSFEPVVGSALQYNMTGGAPSPLASYSVYNSLNPGPFVENPNPGLGMRVSGTNAQAPSLLVDTGMGGPNTIGAYGLFNNPGNVEYLAGQFTLAQAATITSVQGWMQVGTPGSMNVKIYTDNSTLPTNIIPGASIFSQTFTPGANGTEGWVVFPFSNPFPVLSAGKYWISFEPLTGNFFANVDPGAPTPLAHYAFFVSGNNRWISSALDLGMRVYGTVSPGLSSGTAARTVMTGSAFGFPDTPQDFITGGDGVVNSSPWNFIIPSGWSFARGTIIENGLVAGAYSATSGPCGPQSGTCGVGAGRGVAYRSWSNSSNLSLSFKVNAVLDGAFEDSGGTANAGIYIFDATTFANTIAASGQPAPQFLLGNSTLTALALGGPNLSLGGLIPGALLNQFQTVTGPINQSLTIPLTSQIVTIAPNQAITMMFDVSAYAPAFGFANFASTLGPSPTVPLFTDVNGNAVTQLVALGPSVPPSNAPATLTLTPASASIPLGTAGSVTATVLDAGGLAVPNAIVFFAFNSGPNAGPAGPVATDATGKAVFTYTDNGGVGTDMIQATLGTLQSSVVSITWTVPGPLDHITISPANATIASGGSQPYTAAAFDRFNNSIGDVTAATVFTIAPDGSCTGAVCTASVPGAHTVTGTDAGKTAQAMLRVGQITPTITWNTPAAITYGAALSATQLNATASVPGSFVYTPALGAVPNAGAQMLLVVFTPADTTNYTTASAHVTLMVNQATPVITWATPAAINAGTALSATQLNATANVAGTFIYNPGAGTVPGSGNVTLKTTFTPTDTVDYTSATAQVTLVVNASGKKTPVITWATPAAITYGTPLGKTQLNATASVPGTFVYSPKAGTILNAGSQMLTLTFTPTDTATYTNATASVTLQVEKLAPFVIWFPFPIAAGTPLGPLQVDAFAFIPGKFVYTPPAGTVLAAGDQKLSATFTPTDTTNFQTVTVHATLEVFTFDNDFKVSRQNRNVLIPAK